MIHVQTALFDNIAAVAHCGMCGRTLTNPDSKARGIGPVCNGKHRAGESTVQDIDFSDGHIAADITEGVILERHGAQAFTNVPHLVVQHSPDGFEFGYGGSGPADLALNIAEVILQRLGYQGARQDCYDGDCFVLAWHIHQDLKWRFIGPVPQETGATIPYADLLAFVTANLPTATA